MWDIPLERNKDAILVELIQYDKVNAPNSMEKNVVCPKGPLHRYRRTFISERLHPLLPMKVYREKVSVVIKAAQSVQE
jgi:hypothetical protein